MISARAIAGSIVMRSCGEVERERSGGGVSVQAGAGISAEGDPLEAGEAAASAARAALAGSEADLAIVFASGTHLAAPEALLEGVAGVLEPKVLVGCGTGGVLGVGRELESGTGVAVWAAAIEELGQVTPFHADVVRDGDEHHVLGLPDLSDASGAIILSDPYTFPTDAVLEFIARDSPAVPIVGGLSSARTSDGEGALFIGEQVCGQGAVGVVFEDVEIVPCVSQGAAPVGREVTITAAEGNVIRQLAGRPALETIELLVSELSPRERRLVAGGLLIGIVVDPGKPEYEQGDFLVRGLLGADPQSGCVSVGASVEVGQVIRLHARDARSADEDLRRTLRLGVEAMAGSPAAGALVFSCNGRGSAMFGIPDHDAEVVQRELHGAPSAGFFAAGEIGPVAGRSFLHGFTATVAVFPG
jgi:small ligand-binding sensory domain FIST